ncbi:hypothetical protein FOZ60_001065 [Perkinsus olseni]|uniref:Uncharacterized protein n=1 Tax=Perkinsus olseni TaxID=32597 RepID=A0A7J6P138_PEROL|nr:hypothetical protein FOZ60_001065 [Perkinsus olseni]
MVKGFLHKCTLSGGVSRSESSKESDVAECEEETSNASGVGGDSSSWNLATTCCQLDVSVQAHGVEDVGHEGGTEAGNLDGAEYPQRSRLLDPPRADGEALKTEISDGRKRKRGRPGKWGPALKKQYTATKGLPSRGSSTTTPSTPLEPSSSSSPPSIDDYDLPPGVDAHL